MFLCYLFRQWSSANAITQYSPTIFRYLGIQGEESRFLATGLYAVVKFVSVLLFSIFIIDFISRRRSLIVGIILQILTLTFISAYFGVTNGMSKPQIASSASATAASTASIVAIYIHAVLGPLTGSRFRIWFLRRHPLAQRLNFDGISLGLLLRMLAGYTQPARCD